MEQVGQVTTFDDADTPLKQSHLDVEPMDYSVTDGDFFEEKREMQSCQEPLPKALR